MNQNAEYGWKELRQAQQEKRSKNRQQSAQLLRAHQIGFTAKNNGVHLIIHTNPVIDFYPSTGLWAERGTNIKRRGVHRLLNHLKEKNHVNQ